MNTLILAAMLISGGDNNKKWIEETAQAGMAEVRLSQLAVKNATNPDVKQFAQSMITDHSKANDELKALAEKKQVAVPSDVNPEQRKHEDKLMALTGEKFDSEYMKVMVMDHKKVVSHFEKGAKSDDPEIKSWASEKLPTLKHHLEMAQNTEKATKKKS